jgi:hypothetical protein
MRHIQAVRTFLMSQWGAQVKPERALPSPFGRWDTELRLRLCQLRCTPKTTRGRNLAGV